MTQEHISLLLADEHQLYREALATTLMQSRMIHIAAQSSTGPQAEQLFHALRPDILLIDVTMHSSLGLETSSRILSVNPNAKIIWFSTFLRDIYYNRAKENGIRGYLAKSMSYQQILEAITAVHQGNIYLSRQ
jgi:DNA-binding NarL/FixJ family response regulator